MQKITATMEQLRQISNGVSIEPRINQSYGKFVNFLLNVGATGSVEDHEIDHDPD
jgi:hypothetical protein